MGKYSGNGMGPAFRAFWPPDRAGKAMQADLDRRHGRDAETLAAVQELQRVAGLSQHMAKLVREAEASGVRPQQALKVLANEIRHAEECLAALRKSEGAP